MADDAGPWVANVLVALTPYNDITGPLRVVPTSHLWGRLPAEGMPDPSAAHPAEVQVTCDRGDCIVMNAHTWHAGTENRSMDYEKGKAAVHLFWCRRDKPQQQHQKRLIRPEVQASMSNLGRWVVALDSEENEQTMRDHGDQTVSGAIPAAPPAPQPKDSGASNPATRCRSVARI